MQNSPFPEISFLIVEQICSEDNQCLTEFQISKKLGIPKEHVYKVRKFYGIKRKRKVNIVYDMNSDVNPKVIIPLRNKKPQILL